MRTITTCRSCHASALTDIISLGEQYLSDFNDGEKPAKYPLDVVLCENCKLVQLKHSTPPKELYTERYGYRSGINEAIRNDLKEIVMEAVKTVDLRVGDHVIDIGANDGTLLSYYPETFFRTAYEPVKKFATECLNVANVVIPGFFRYMDTKAKIITAISCFYDLDDPNEFVAAIKKMLAPDGVFIIQQNYLGGMIKQNAFDNIVHEHLEFYSLLSLENLLRRHKLEVFRVKENSINGGSFRTFISHIGSREIEQSVHDMRVEEENLGLDKKWAYENFAKRCKDIKVDLYNFVRKQVKDGKKVYVYGASTRGNTLLQYCGLEGNLITAAVERNPEKWGKVFAGPNIPIISEEQARREKPDYFLILPWFFREVFETREKEYMDQGGSLIFPLPSLEVIGGHLSNNTISERTGTRNGTPVSGPTIYQP